MPICTDLKQRSEVAVTALRLTLVGFLFIAVVIPVAADEIDCGFYNEVEMTDPAGDATPGAPSYVDILGLEIRQFRDMVQFRWRSDGDLRNQDRMYFFLVFDTDFDSETGQHWGPIGAEIKITVASSADISRFNPNGDWVSSRPGPPVIFKEDGFVIDIDRSELGTSHFHLYFESSGQPPWRDDGLAREIVLEPSRPGPVISVNADHYVNRANPTVINIPDQQTGVQLGAHLRQNGILSEIDASAIEFNIFHDSPLVPDPEAIVSVDENEVAHYISEGYVLATVEITSCGLNSAAVILATGDAYRHTDLGHVVAVWPTGYSPSGIGPTYGEIMGAHPDYMRAVNTWYLITSDLYRGFLPFGGNTLVFATLEVDSACHSGNPLQSPPGCFFHHDGSPEYTAIVHENGHNFQQTNGMSLLKDSRIAQMGFGECSASLPAIYLFSEIPANGETYGFGPGTYEWSYFESWRQQDRSNFDDFDEFEDRIRSGEITGIFDETGGFDGVAMFCCLFQTHIYGHNEYSSPYGHELIRRFLNIYADEDMPAYRNDKAETYFAAAFDAAAGKDLRHKFSFWGFEIDDEFYDEIMPIIESRIELFSDRFEFGDLHKWSTVQP
jgi:hypothetical protein